MQDIVLISIPETSIRNIVKQAVKDALKEQAEQIHSESQNQEA